MQASSLPCMSWKESWRPRGEGRAGHHGLDPVEVQRPMGRFNDIANRVKSDRVGWEPDLPNRRKSLSVERLHRQYLSNRKSGEFQE